MANERYVATDRRTGMEVAITGEFPADSSERVRIARTANLFTRLLSTILSTENSVERKERFRALETVLEVADALIRGDQREAQQILRGMLLRMGMTEDQLREAGQQMREQFEQATGQRLEGEAGALFGIFEGEPTDQTQNDSPTPGEDVPPETESQEGRP